jgi:hypothetical protein
MVNATAASGATAITNPAVGTSSSLPHAGAATTSLNDDNVLEVVIGCPCLHALEPIPLLEALDAAHSALRQVQHVFQ